MISHRLRLSCLFIGLFVQPPLHAQPPAETPGSLAAHWQNLLEADGEKAYASMRQLARTPQEALAFLRETVKPAAGVEAKVIEELIRQLGSDRFAEREKAVPELERYDRLALPGLKKAAQETTELEPKRRMNALIERLEGRLSGLPVRWRRAVEVVEWIGTPDAKALLEHWSQGAAEARLTHEARRALGRWSQSEAAVVSALKQPRLDADGDPLPAGAMLRLGTTRWRADGKLPGGSGLLYDADGKRLIVFDYPTINVVDVRDGKTLFREEYDGIISKAFLSSDGRRFIAAARTFQNILQPLTSNLWVWDMKELKKISHKEVNGYVVGIAQNGKIALLVDAKSEVVREYDVESGEELRVHDAPANSKFNVIYIYETFAMAYRADTKQFLVYEWANPTKMASFAIKKLSGRPTISPDGKIFACPGGADAGVTLYDRATGQQIRHLEPKGLTPNSICDFLRFSPDGKTLTFFFSADKFVYDKVVGVAWDMEKNAFRWQTKAVVGELAFSPDSRFLAGRADSRIIILDALTGKELSGAKNGASTLKPELEFASDGRGIWHSKRDELCYWEFPSGRLQTTLPHENVAVAAISQDGQHAVTASADGAAHIWDVASAKKLKELPGSDPRPGGLAFAPDGKRVATLGRDLVLRNFDVASGRLAAEHRLWPKELSQLKEDDDQSPEKRLARIKMLLALQRKLKFDTGLTTDGSRSIWSFDKHRIYGAFSGKELSAIEGTSDGNTFNAQRAKTSADLEWLLVGSQGIQGKPQSVTLYNLRLGRMQGELKFEFPSFSTDFAMAPDGLCLAVATDRPQAKIHIYETATLQRRFTISQEYGGVTRLAFSPGSRFLAAAQTDGTVLVYDLAELR